MTTMMYRRPRVRSFPKSPVPVSATPEWCKNFLDGRRVTKCYKVESLDTKSNERRIDNFEGYKNGMIRNEKQLLEKPKKDLELLVSVYIKKNDICYRKLLLERWFCVWAGKGFLDGQTYIQWQSDYRRVLRLAAIEYVRQLRIYRRSMELLIEKIVVHKRYNLLKNFFVWWKEVGVKVDEQKTIPEGNPMYMSRMTKREGVRKSTGEKVEVKTRVYPLRVLYETYHSNGVLIPIIEKVKTYHQLGYPKWYLEKMILSRDKRMSRKAEMEEMIENVFGKYMSKSKGAIPKAKTLQQMFK